MKAIMMSIKPKYVSMILNKVKTIELRKRFPSDYVGWVYIYVTKALPHLSKTYVGDYEVYDDTQWDKEWLDLNGKVVARFWCDKVEEITYYPKKPFDRYGTPYRATYDLLTESCLEYDELDNYLNKNNGYAIHITKLEIFNKQKEISEFKTKLHIKGGCKNCPQNTGLSMSYCKTCDFILPLTRAPQSYCFIEI